MKPPLSPPPLNELLARHRSGLPRILRAAVRPTVEDRYVHWSKLGRLEPPEGLDHEQWWLGIKLARNSQSRDLPLRDTSGQPFAWMLPDRVQEALSLIDRQSAGHIGIPEDVMNPHTRDRFIVSSLINEATTSSQLEGASTTRVVAADMLRSNRRPRDRSERMIFNNYLTMHDIHRIRHEPLTLETVLGLHATLTADTLDDPHAVGRIQRPEDKRVQVWDERDQQVLHTPPRAQELPARLDAMVEFANRGPGVSPFLHPVIHAIALHFWLAYDHPFEDGNGRTARALFYWAMLHHGYWMFEFTSISRRLRKAPGRYTRAFLHTETDGNDLTYFIAHQIEVILGAIDDVNTYITRKIEEVREVDRSLRHSSALNHRQLALLAHAIRHPDAEYTVRSHMTSHKVVYATARSDLLGLVESSLLNRRRIGRKTWLFHPPPDLGERTRTPPARG